ncbi:MAG: NAD-dependent isocitrate dehydrogenase, partial [Anaerolineae bacterium]|nr:NAD-dependent isocitrate dehydrogenase [Anaerolineae bacterium]
MELCVIEGDGIGHEVVPAAVEVLRKVAPDIVIHFAPAGWDYFQQYGIPLPDATIELAFHCAAVLF